MRFSVKNTGDMAGAEIAQLYIAPHTHGMFRPAKELRGFARITLAPGEEREVEITLTGGALPCGTRRRNAGRSSRASMRY